MDVSASRKCTIGMVAVILLLSGMLVLPGTTVLADSELNNPYINGKVRGDIDGDGTVEAIESLNGITVQLVNVVTGYTYEDVTENGGFFLFEPVPGYYQVVVDSQKIGDSLYSGYESTIENMVKYVNDIAGIRVICSFTSDIYRIAEMIRLQNDIHVIAVKDYIRLPKASGYKSYHMLVTVPVSAFWTTLPTDIAGMPAVVIFPK